MARDVLRIAKSEWFLIETLNPRRRKIRVFSQNARIGGGGGIRLKSSIVKLLAPCENAAVGLSSFNFSITWFLELFCLDSLVPKSVWVIKLDFDTGFRHDLKKWNFTGTLLNFHNRVYSIHSNWQQTYAGIWKRYINCMVLHKNERWNVSGTRSRITKLCFNRLWLIFSILNF